MVELVGFILKVWFNRFMYGMYPNAEQWRINITFISGFGSYNGWLLFVPTKTKKIFNPLLYNFFTNRFISVLIYYLISGGEFGLVWVETGAWGGLSLTFIVSFFSLIFLFSNWNDVGFR